jgi:hypothetical protein
MGNTQCCHLVKEEEYASQINQPPPELYPQYIQLSNQPQ